METAIWNPPKGIQPRVKLRPCWWLRNPQRASSLDVCEAKCRPCFPGGKRGLRNVHAHPQKNRRSHPAPKPVFASGEIAALLVAVQSSEGKFHRFLRSKIAALLAAAKVGLRNVARRFAQRKIPPASLTGFFFGSPNWARTSDIMINSHALYRLSYGGI